MGTFLKAGAGSFVGRLVASTFLAVCVVLGVGPDKWAATLVGLEPGAWLWVARTGFLALAGLAAWFAFVAPGLANSTLILTWRYRPEDADIVPVRRMIRMTEAARRAYEKFRGLSVSKQRLPAMAADRLSDGSPLSWFACALAGSNEIPVYGIHPPSNALELVSAELVRAEGHYSDDANSLSYYDRNDPEYVDLSIKVTDFKKRLNEMSTWDIGDA